MKRTILFATFLVLLTASAALAGGRYDHRYTDNLNQELSFSSSSAAKKVIVENVIGSIRVETHRGDTVRLSVDKELTAQSAERLEAAKEEIFLNITESNNVMSLVVDGPFRDPDGEWNIDLGKLGYWMKYDFVLHVPEYTDVELKTINDGNIDVRGPIGGFLVRNVNGSISIEGANAAGKAKTVNGKVVVSFSDMPTTDCEFTTINGDVDITFPGDLSADFDLETMNGDIYSAFDYDHRPNSTIKRTKKGDLTRIKLEDVASIRIGNGGMKVNMKTLNGDLKIRKL